MNKIIVLLVVAIVLLHATGFAQAVGINTSTPDNTAIFDIKSNTKGILLPRTSTTSRLAIVQPAKGLILYDTTASAFYFYNGSAWSQLSVGSSGWNLNGNAGTNPVNHFVGTTDAQSLRFRVNNVWAGEIHHARHNLFFGVNAGSDTTTGIGNTGIGSSALLSIGTGNFNTASGYEALENNTTASFNTAIGYGSLYNNKTGNSNTAVGTAALYENTIGAENTGTGYTALYSNKTGTGNTANGFQALYANTKGDHNTATGSKALYTNSAYGNTANGYHALFSNTSGGANVAVGFKTLYANTEGYGNSALGSVALTSNRDGYTNTAIGYYALSSNINAQDNTATGAFALANNLSGIGNTANGFTALLLTNTGHNNTAMGFGALENNTGGNNNIAIGYNAGNNSGAANVNNSIGIGNDGYLNGTSNQVLIGNNSTVYIGGLKPWSIPSDKRIKRNIKEEVVGLDFIMKLRPVTYFRSIKAIQAITGDGETRDFPEKYDVEKIKETGFLAQEVDAAAKAVNFNFNGVGIPAKSNQMYTLSYELFVVPLVKAMQEQQAIIISQQKQLDLLAKRLAALEEKVAP
jgi:hypothetical protein